jgi:putative phosphoesterase
MKILAFTDTHGSLSAFRRISKLCKKKKPDIIICAGDFTIFEAHMKKILELFSSFGIPMLIIHGNHEGREHTQKLCKAFPNLIFMHKKTYKKDGINFVGYGGGGFGKHAPDFKDFFKPKEKTILILHQPPFGTRLDRIAGLHCGNLTYREAIDKTQPFLVICGHLHENAGKKDKVGKTLLTNPGPYGKIINV